MIVAAGGSEIKVVLELAVTTGLAAAADPRNELFFSQPLATDSGALVDVVSEMLSQTPCNMKKKMVCKKRGIVGWSNIHDFY